MSVWYNQQTEAIAIQLRGWNLFEVEDLANAYLYFPPKRPWIRLGDL